MKWPKRIKYRNRALATIYRKTAHYPLYRVCWRANGRRQMKAYPTYSEAKAAAETLVKGIAEGSQVAALTAGQANDALTAFERLRRFYVETGRLVSLTEVVGEWCESAGKLNGHSTTMTEAIERFVSNLAVVRRKLLSEAVKEFNESRKHLSESKNGERSRRSPVYIYNTTMWLKEFANTFPNYAVCDLNKEHLNTYIAKFKELSSKSRNDRRAIVKQFLGWCVAKDYLAQSHRLFEAVEFKTEERNAHEIDFYRPKELRDMLNAADSDVVPVLALGGLAGLRREEIMRLDWADVWRVSGKIEIGARIAKGRKRRLVDVCSSLARWLRGYRNKKGLVWSKSPDALEEALAAVRKKANVPARRNALRHGFITAHMALYCNENLTAAESGNSPQIIHDHYRALVPRKEAVAWFKVGPLKSGSGSKVIEFPTAKNG